jgi:hypothetical protein
LITPRLVIAVLWLFTRWFAVVPAGIWILLGFIFLPTTLLWYTAVQHWFAGEWSLVPLIGIVIALAVDVSPASNRRR